MIGLKIITSTTREGRKGIYLAEWIFELAKKHGEFNVELLDLAKINLPFMDEPNHPRLQQYTKEHTKQWSETISNSDAFIIVLAEYNYGYPAPIKNALDYLVQEWKNKPLGFVSYGGVAAGTRSLQMLKQVTGALMLYTVPTSVSIPAFTKFINEQNEFRPEEGVIKSANNMLKEILDWHETLKPLRK